MVRARIVILLVPILLLTSAIIAQEPQGLLNHSQSDFEITNGALLSEGPSNYTGIGASFNVDFMGQFANGSSWSDSTTSLAEDLTAGTSFSAANGSASVEWTAYVLISPPYNISSVNLTLTSIPSAWVLADVLDSSLVSRYPSSGVDAASGEVNVSSSVIDKFGVWTFTFTDSNGATNLECGINAGGYTTTRSYQVGDFASFRGTAPVTAGSRMRLYLTDPFGITQYAADQTQSGPYFEWTGISIQSDWPVGVWHADVDFNNTGGTSPTFVGSYQRSFNVTHYTSLSLRTPGDAVGDSLTERIMGDLLYVSVDLLDDDNSELVPSAAVTLNWTDHGTPVIHTLADYGNGTYGIALNTTDLESAGQWRINIDSSHDHYTSSPTLNLDLDLYDPTELTYKSVYSTPIGYDFTATLAFRDVYTGTPIAGASITYSNGTSVNVVSAANGEYNITVPSGSLTLGEHWYVFNASKPSSYVQMASVNVTFLLRTHQTAVTVSGNLTIPFGFNTSLSVVLVDLDTGLNVGIGNVSSFSFTSSYGTQDYVSPTSSDLILNTESWNVELVSVTLSVTMSSSDYDVPSDYTFSITVRPHYTIININGNLTRPYGLTTPLTVVLLDMDTGEHLGLGNVSQFIFASSYGTEFFNPPTSFDVTLPTNTWSVGSTTVTLSATLPGGDYLEPSDYVFEIVMRPHLTAVSVGGEFLIPYGANANVTVVLIDLDLNIEVPIGFVDSFSFSSDYGTQPFNSPASYDVMLSTSTWLLGSEAVTLSVGISSSIYSAPSDYGFNIQIRAHHTSLSVTGNLTTLHGFDTPLTVVLLDLDTGVSIDIGDVSQISFTSVYPPQSIFFPPDYDLILDTDGWNIGKVLVTVSALISPSEYEDPDSFVFEVTIRAHFTTVSISANLTQAYGGDIPVSIHLVDADTGSQIPIGDVGSFSFISSYGTQTLSSPSGFDVLLDSDAWLVGLTVVNLSVVISNSIFYSPTDFVFNVTIRPHYTSVTITGNLTITFGTNSSLTVVLTDLDTGLVVDVGSVALLSFASSYGTQDFTTPSSYDIVLDTDSWTISTTNVTLSVSMAGTTFSNPSDFEFQISVRARRTAVYVHGELITPYGLDTNLTVVLLDLDSGTEIAINDVDAFSFVSTYGTYPISSPTTYNVTLATNSWSVSVVVVTLSVSFSVSQYAIPADYVFELTIRNHITSAWVVGEFTTPYGEDTNVTVFVKDLDTDAFIAVSEVASISFSSIYGTETFSSPSSYSVLLSTNIWTVGFWDVDLSISLSGSAFDDPANHSFVVVIRNHLTSVTVQGNLTTPYGMNTPIIVLLTDIDTGLVIDIANVDYFNFSSSYGPQLFNSPGSSDILLTANTWSVGTTPVTLSVSLAGSIYDDPLSYVFDVAIRPHFTAASLLRDLQTPYGMDTGVTLVLIDLDLGTQIDIGNVSLIEFTSSYGTDQFASPSSLNITLDTDSWDLGSEIVTMTMTMVGSIYHVPNDYIFDIFIRKHHTSVSVSGNLTIPYGIDTQLTVVLTDLDTMSSIPIGDVMSFNLSSVYGPQGIAPTGYDVTLDTNLWDIGATAVTLDVSMQVLSIYFDPENFTFSINVRRHFTAVSVSGELVVPYGSDTHVSILLLDLDTGMSFAISNVSSFVFDSTYGPQNFVPPTSYDIILATDTWSVGVTEVTLSVLYSSSILNAPADLAFNVTIRKHYTSSTVKGSMTTLFGFDSPLTVEVIDLDTGLQVDIADISAFTFTSSYAPQVFNFPSSYNVILDTDTWVDDTVSINLIVAISGSIHNDPSIYSFILNFSRHQTTLSVAGDLTVPHGENVSLTFLLIDSDLGISVDISDVAWIFFASAQGDQNETTLSGFDVTLSTSTWSLGITTVTVSVGLSNSVYDSPNAYEFNVTIRMHYTAVSVSGNLETPIGENTLLDVVLIDLDTGLAVPIGTVDNFAFTSIYGTEPFPSPASYGLQLTTDTWGIGSREVNLSVSLAGSIYENPSDFTFNITIRLRYTSATVSGTLVVPYAFETNLTVIILDLDSGSMVDEVNVDSMIFDSTYSPQVSTAYNVTLDTSTWSVGTTSVTLAVSLAGSDYANPTNYTFTIEIRPHMTAVSVEGVLIQPYGNQTSLRVVLTDLDTMNPIAITNVTSFTFDSSYGPQSIPSPLSYDVTLDTSLWSVGTTSVTLSVAIATSHYLAPQSHVFQVTIRSLRIQLYHEPGDLIFPNGDDFQLVLGVKVTEPGPYYNDSLTGLLQSEFSVSGYTISITEVEPGRYRLVIDESFFTQGNYTIEIVIDPLDSRYSTDLLAVYFMYTPARSFLSSPNYPQVTTPYGADVNITLEYTDVDRGVGITGATMTPEGISITFSEHPTIQGTYIVTLIAASLETGSYSFNITAEAADYQNKTLSFILLIRVVYTYAIPTLAALDIPVGNSPVFYVEYWDVDHDVSVSNETPFLVTGTWSSFTVTYEPGAPRPRYKIVFTTFDDTPLEQNRVVTFNFSKGQSYQFGVFTVTVTIRTHNTDFRLVSAVEPTSYRALLNISVYYGDLDNLVGIQDSRLNHYVEGDSGILVSTLFNDTSPGYYIVQINATEFGTLGVQNLEIFFNWTGAVQKYHNLTLLVSVNIIGAESSYTLLSASEPTPYLNNMSYVFLYKDLYTGQGVTNISYGGGNVHIYVVFQEVIVDIGQMTIWEVDPILYPGQYSVEFNTTILGSVGAFHMEVYINWSSGAEPYYTNRTDIITVRILPRDTLVSIIPPSPTPYGENATFSFTFDDVTGGLSESIHNASNMIVTLGIPDFTISYNTITRIFSVSFNTSQLVTDSVGQVAFTLDVEWLGEPFYANRTGRLVFVSIIQRLTILEYTSPPPSPFNDIVTFTVTWTDVTGALPHGVAGATLTLYEGSSGPEINSVFYSWLDLNDGRYRISLNSSYAGMLGTHDLNLTLTTSLFYLANRTAIRSFAVGPRTSFLSSEPVGRIAYNTSIEIILYYQDLVNLAMIGNATSEVSIEILNGSSWVFVSSWEALNEYYLITVQTSNHPELLVNTPYVLWFNMSYADSPPFYDSADTFVRIQFRHRASTIELNEAPQPTPYLDSVNLTILYRDVDLYGEIQGASITVRKSGVPLVFGTDYTVTSQAGGLYLLSIDTEALDGIGPTSITVYANWSHTAPYYSNATLNIVLTTILRYTNVEIVAPPSQTRYLDLVEFTVAVVDLGTGSAISVPLNYFKLYNGSAIEILATQFSIQDIGGNLYEISINSTILSSRLVTNHELIVSVEFLPIVPYHRSDNTTARVTTTNRIGSVVVGQVLSTPLGDNMTLGFTFVDESSGIGVENATILFDCLNVSLVEGTDFWITEDQGAYVVWVDTDSLGDVGTYQFSLSVQWDPLRQPFYLNTTTLTLTGSVRLTDTLLTSDAPTPYTVPYTDNVSIVVTFTDLDHAEGIEGAGPAITINYTETGFIPAIWDYEVVSKGKYRIVINTTDAGDPDIKTMQISIDHYPYRLAWVQLSFQVRLRDGVLTANVSDAYAGETVIVLVNLTDSDAYGAPIDGATLNFTWDDPSDIVDLGNGLYEIYLNTSSKNQDIYTIFIEASATDFRILPLAIDFELYALRTEVVTQEVAPTSWGDSVTISAIFNDTINNELIRDATLTFTWDDNSYTMNEPTPGIYTAELDTSLVPASTYYIVIRANKTNYRSSFAQITLVVDFLDIEVTLVNGIFATVNRGEEVNMTVFLNDTYNDQPLLGANVTVYWTFNESREAALIELGNGYYWASIETDDSESAESYQVIVTAVKTNYQPSSEVLTLGIRQTETAVWFDAVSQGYEDLIFNWSQVIRIGVYVVAPELDVANDDYYLENCTVTWKSGSYFGNLTFDGNKFYFDFNTTEYPAQTYSFRITAVPKELAFSLSGNGTIIIVQTIQTALIQPENVNQIWGWTGWFNFTYWDVYHDAGIDDFTYGRSVYALYSWPGESGTPFYFGNGSYGVFIDTSLSVPRSDPYTIVIEFQLDNFVPQLGRFNLIISPIPAQIIASAPELNQIDNSTINLRVPSGDTLAVGLRYSTVGVNTNHTPYIGGIADAVVVSSTFTGPDFPIGLREPFTLFEIGEGNYSFSFDTGEWLVSAHPYHFSVYLSYGNRTDAIIVISITIIDVPTLLEIEDIGSSFAVVHGDLFQFTVYYIDTWEGHGGAGIEGALFNDTSTADIEIEIVPMGAGEYQVTVTGRNLNETGGFFSITFSKENHVTQTTIDISYRITPNDTDRMIATVTNYGIPFGILIIIFGVIYNRVLKLPKRVRQMRKMINALRKGKVPKPVDDVFSRQEMVANLFDDTMKALEITTTVELVPEYGIIVDVPEMGELLIQLAILTRLSAEELEDFRRDIAKMRVSEQAAFVKEVINQEALRVARVDRRKYEEVLEDVAIQARRRLVGDDIIAMAEIDSSMIDAEPLVLTEEKAKIEFDEPPSEVDEIADPEKDEPPVAVREYMKPYEIDELRIELEARGMPRDEVMVILEQAKTLPRELVDDLIKSLVGEKKKD